MSELLSRRGFLASTALAALPSLSVAETPSFSSSIGVYLDGAMSPIDSFDYKPNAPKEVKGETGKPNITESVILSPYFPALARVAKHIAFIRTMVSKSTSHDTADRNALLQEKETLAFRLGKIKQGGIPYVYGELPDADKNSIYKDPHKPSEGLEFVWDEKLQCFIPPHLEPPERLRERRDLLRLLDTQEGPQRFKEQRELAYELLSGTLPEFDLPQKDVERYGNCPIGKAILLAVRLARKKARSIVIRTNDWDYHTNIHARMEKPARQLDQAMAEAIRDHVRGQWHGVFWARTEFGRTPTLNTNQGRDHHKVHSSMLMGEKIVPQVLGATDNMLSVKEGPTVSDKDFDEILHEAMGHKAFFDNPVVSRVLRRT